jgi:UDP-2-acetamido-2,6-beta-L-arabino-hexul-4-ose reductase
MKRVGITGQAGFIGSHLFNFLKHKQDIILVPFDDAYFETPAKLSNFAIQCDVIVHLAAVNRCDNPEQLYITNVKLVQQLIEAMDVTNTHPHVIFSSSIQEEYDNLYGKSKQKGREMFNSWAAKNNALFTGLIIPNVYGPFGKPYYNSVIATFCHQLTHNETPKINIDGLLKLIYITDLVGEIYKIIISGQSQQKLLLPHTDEKRVSELLLLLENYKTLYFDQGIIPVLSSLFEINLFNTFRSYIDYNTHFPVMLKKNTDERGTFVETVKLHNGGLISFSTTKPHKIRGNHYHTRKIERFVVIQGNARVQLRKIDSDEVLNFVLSGENPAYIDIPVWYTHNISNIGETELITQFWINELFDPCDTDTFFELVESKII